MRSEADRFGKLGIVGRLSDECVYIAYRRGGRVTRMVNLQGSLGEPKPKLAVGDPQAGMQATWTFMKELEPAFGATAIRFTEGTLAINHLATGMLDAVGWVTDPHNLNHKMLRAVYANDELDVLELDDADVAHALPDGTRVYEIKQISLTGGLAPRKIRTICTSSGIFSRAGVEKRLIDAVSDVLSLEREAILSLDD
jgi:hypothetical protein